MTDKELDKAIANAEYQLQFLNDRKMARKAFRETGKFIAVAPGYQRQEFSPGQDCGAAYWLARTRENPVPMMLPRKTDRGER